MSINEIQITDHQQSMLVKASAAEVFDALTTITRLSSWWTRATGSGGVGGELRFYFDSPTDACVMQVDRADRPTRAEWTVTQCAFLPDWVGTRPTFTITPVGDDAAELHFRHHGLTPDLDCIEMCTVGWTTYLASLRHFVEGGSGSPFGSLAEAG